MSSTGADNDTIPVAELRNVSRSFAGFPALDGVSLRIDRGEILGLIGRSGAGKSTLIRCLNGLERPDSGEIFIEGQPITGLEERALLPFRRRIGMIFQHFNLLSAKTVLDNVALPLKIAGVPAAAREARARALLDLVGLADKAGAFPAQLSGGQKQRVGIARALSAQPALLLSDEATSALDPETTDQILDLLRDINRQLGLTVLLITHEMEVVRSIARRVAVIDRGRIVEEGPVWSLFADPETATARSLLGGMRPRLPEAFAEKLQAEPGAGTLYALDVTGPRAYEPVVTTLSAAAQAGLAVVHGGVDHIQGHAVARYFILGPAAAQLDPHRLVSIAATQNLALEFLGHVSDPV